MAAPSKTHALSLKIISECTKSKARSCKLSLPHQVVDTPVFMHVGTQGTLKGMTVNELEDLDCQIMLGNTYHLGHRPVIIIYLYFVLSEISLDSYCRKLMICSLIFALKLKHYVGLFEVFQPLFL